MVDQKGQSKLAGFVRFNNEAEATKAIQAMNGTKMGGADSSPLVVKYADNEHQKSLRRQRKYSTYVSPQTLIYFINTKANTIPFMAKIQIDLQCLPFAKYVGWKEATEIFHTECTDYTFISQSRQKGTISSTRPETLSNNYDNNYHYDYINITTIAAILTKQTTKITIVITTNPSIRSKFGPLQSVRVITDKDTGENKGYGFVKFQNKDDAIASLNEMNGLQVGQKYLKVKFKDHTTPTMPSGSSGGHKSTAAQPKNEQQHAKVN
eukprot:gene6511-7541_t